MNDDKIFYDSNILIYLVDRDFRKKEKVSSILVDESYISTQVVNENVSICFQKLLLDEDTTFKHCKFLVDKFHLIQIDKNIIYKAFEIRAKYKYNFWDCLIISSALSCEATKLYTEDMQHDQFIEGKLKMINPFRE